MLVKSSPLQTVRYLSPGTSHTVSLLSKHCSDMHSIMACSVIDSISTHPVCILLSLVACLRQRQLVQRVLQLPQRVLQAVVLLPDTAIPQVKLRKSMPSSSAA